MEVTGKAASHQNPGGAGVKLGSGDQGVNPFGHPRLSRPREMENRVSRALAVSHQHRHGLKPLLKKFCCRKLCWEAKLACLFPVPLARGLERGALTQCSEWERCGFLQEKHIIVFHKPHICVGFANEHSGIPANALQALGRCGLISL